MTFKFKINQDIEVKNTVHPELNGCMARIVGQSEQLDRGPEFNLYHLKFVHDEKIYFVCAEQYLFDIDFYELYGISKS